VVLDAGLRDILINGASNGEIEPRAAGAWLAQALAKEAGGTIQLSEHAPEVLIIGAVVPRQG
jgi:histidine phosphotransferase ChpT